MTDQVNVQPDALDAAAARQQNSAEAVRAGAERLASVVSTGNAFGLIGEMAGTKASYEDWAANEAQGLRDLTRYLSDLAEGLRHTARAYREADQAGLDALNAAYPGEVSV